GQYVRVQDAGPGCGRWPAAIREGSDHASRGAGAPDGSAEAAAARALTTARAAASSSGVGLPRTTLIVTTAPWVLTGGCCRASSGAGIPAWSVADAGPGRCGGGSRTA